MKNGEARRSRIIRSGTKQLRDGGGEVLQHGTMHGLVPASEEFRLGKWRGLRTGYAGKAVRQGSRFDSPRQGGPAQCAGSRTRIDLAGMQCHRDQRQAAEHHIYADQQPESPSRGAGQACENDSGQDQGVVSRSISFQAT
jgi:hypothetical protein